MIRIRKRDEEGNMVYGFRFEIKENAEAIWGLFLLMSLEPVMYLCYTILKRIFPIQFELREILLRDSWLYLFNILQDVMLTQVKFWHWFVERRRYWKRLSEYSFKYHLTRVNEIERFLREERFLS